MMSLYDIFFQGLLVLHNKIRVFDDDTASELHVIRRLWVAMHDEEEEIRELATDLWNKLRYKTNSTLCTELLVRLPPYFLYRLLTSVFKYPSHNWPVKRSCVT